MSIHSTYPANFIETTIFQQIQQLYIYNFIRHIGSTKIINKKEIINNQTYIQWTMLTI